ncbi:MAG TPA: FHA domain-containing protein [Kofleriaceae bacterium]|nr:FHA domain-containing protein [Kofleriaceae bacterium]
MDQSKKTMRHFYCRDVLWETFEQMANDFDCSIDYLINESMRYYARSKNYPAAGQGASSASMSGRPEGAGPGHNPPSATQPPPVGMGARRPAPTTSPPPSQPPTAPNAPRRPAPPTPAGHMGGGVPMGGALAAPRAAPAPTYPPPAAPAPPPPRVDAGLGGSPTLFLMFNGQRYPVSKDQFIIGRGPKTSDLAIKDGNISRKHAAVIRRNGTFYIKDLGSTNGIDYKGMRIDNKRIDEGDVFHLCDYELRFTYRGD